jgi:hypothetical protein
MEACKSSNLFNSFIKGLQDIKMPTFYRNDDIKPVISDEVSVKLKLRKDYKKSLVEIRKVANEFTN